MDNAFRERLKIAASNLISIDEFLLDRMNQLVNDVPIANGVQNGGGGNVYFCIRS
jgi:hypothetical protein